MKKRIALLILTAVLTMILTACRGGGEKEPKEKWISYGWREYSYDSDVHLQNRLVTEYADLGTERSYIRYGEKPWFIERWYYTDTSPRILLKHVCWEEGLPTSAEEYDSKGRLVRILRKYEEGSNHSDSENGASDFTFPDEYFELAMREQRDFCPSVHWDELAVASGVKEIHTEITYADDSDVIRKISTVTDSGEEIGHLEFGENDIILQFFLLGANGQYREEYDPDTQTGKVSSTLDEAEFSGTKGYNSSGRLVSMTVNANKLEYLTTYDYNDSGCRRTAKAVLPEGWQIAVCRWALDTKGRVHEEYGYICDAGYDSEDIPEDSYIEHIRYTYHENGQIATYVYEYYQIHSGEKLFSYGIEEDYSSDGVIQSSRWYDEDTVTPGYTETWLQGEATGVAAGRILHTERNYPYQNGKMDVIIQDYVEVPDEFVKGETKRVCYHACYSYESLDPPKTWTEIRGEFDSEGRLQRILKASRSRDIFEQEKNGEVFEVQEYDTEGRLIKTFNTYTNMIDKDNEANDNRREWGTFIEYWEGEDPGVKAEAGKQDGRVE